MTSECVVKRRTHSAPTAIEQTNASGRISYWQGADNQSVADRDGISLADYIHAMYFFIRKAKARHVLMIGCGGGTLATMLARARIRVTMLDIDAASFEIARRYFHLPPSVACHVADGRAFLRRTAERYDAIVLDAYSNETIPRHFLTTAFLDLAKAHLRRRGIFLMNLLAADDEDRTPDRIAGLLKKTWRQVRLLDAVGWDDRNAVAIAGAVTGLTRPRLLLKPRRGARTVAAGLRALDFRDPRA